MVAHAASTRIWPIVESSAAFLRGCPPCGRTRSRLDMAEYSSRYAQRSRTTPSRGGPSQKVIPCGAPARTSRSIWTEPTLSCRNRLSVRHLAYHRVPSDFRRPTRSASDQRHVVTLSYTLSRDTTRKGDKALKAELEEVLKRKAADIKAILEAYGVPLVTAEVSPTEEKGPEAPREGRQHEEGSHR